MTQYAMYTIEQLDELRPGDEFTYGNSNYEIETVDVIDFEKETIGVEAVRLTGNGSRELFMSYEKLADRETRKIRRPAKNLTEEEIEEIRAQHA